MLLALRPMEGMRIHRPKGTQRLDLREVPFTDGLMRRRRILPLGDLFPAEPRATAFAGQASLQSQARTAAFCGQSLVSLLNHSVSLASEP